MVSNGVRDFVVLLQVLAQDEMKGRLPVGTMLGRCPDCRATISGSTPQELIGDILGHVCLYHSETADAS